MLALEIAVDSLAAAVVGLGGATSRDRRGSTGHAGHSSVDDVVADLVGLARRVLAGETAGRHARRDRGRGRRRRPACRRRRRDGAEPGLASMCPWAAGLRPRSTTPVPISVANEADLGALAEHRRGAAVGVDHVLYVSGEVGVGGGLIVDGRPLTGVAGYSGEVGHIPVNPDGQALSLRLGRLLGDATSERAPCCAAPDARTAVVTAVDAVLRDAAAGSASRLAALDDVGRWLGIGLAGLVNILNPELVVLGGLLRPDPSVRRRPRGASWTAGRSGASRRSSGSSRRGSASMPRCSARPSSRFEPLLADPAAWVGRGTRSPSWRAREPCRPRSRSDPLSDRVAAANGGSLRRVVA